MTSEAGRERTRREFSHQAERFERPGYIFSDRAILDWIRTPLPLDPASLVLDVAGGTGRLGRHLAREAACAVVVDLTSEMLAEGTRAAREEGARNVVFLSGDASALPFVERQFDLVVCRFALHHFEDPAGAVREMARVCRAGGTVAVIDMAREPGPAGERHDELERLRDPSHTTALTEQELLDCLTGAGLKDVRRLGERQQRMHVSPWLDQASPTPEARARIEHALAEEGPGTGLHPEHDHEGKTGIAHRWVIVAGTRASE
jgi:ubiquinone/menaquinone biosynthesis C-methylase UbiE